MSGRQTEGHAWQTGKRADGGRTGMQVDEHTCMNACMRGSQTGRRICMADVPASICTCMQVGRRRMLGRTARHMHDAWCMAHGAWCMVHARSPPLHTQRRGQPGWQRLRSSAAPEGSK
eukprot:350065-Chlamydomonas_euryale.AAC.4